MVSETQTRRAFPLLSWYPFSLRSSSTDVFSAFFVKHDHEPQQFFSRYGIRIWVFIFIIHAV